MARLFVIPGDLWPYLFMLMRGPRMEWLSLENQIHWKTGLWLWMRRYSQGGEQGLERRSSHGPRIHWSHRAAWCLDKNSLDIGAQVSLPRWWWHIGPSRAATQVLRLGPLPNFALSAASSFGVNLCYVCFKDKMAILSPALFWPLCTILGNY